MGFGEIVHTRVDCEADSRSRCQAVKDILIDLEERIDHLTNEAGVFAGNLPSEVKVMTRNDDRLLSALMQHTTEGQEAATFQDDTTDWELVTKSGNLDATPSLLGISPNGLVALAVRRDSTNTDTDVYTISNGIVQTPATVSGTWSELHASATFSGRVAWKSDGTYAAFFHYGGGTASFIVVDMSDGTLAGSVSTTIAQNTNSGNPVWHGDYVYWPEGSTGDIVVFDVSDPTSPTELATFATSLSAIWDLVASGTALYGVGTGGVVGLDITDPSSISEDDDETGLASTYVSMDLDDGVLFMAVRASSTQVRVATVDISGTTVTLNTEALVNLSTSAMTGHSCIFHDNYAIVWSGWRPSGANTLEAHVFNVSNPASVAFVETLSYTHASGGHMGPEISRSTPRGLHSFNFQTESQVTRPLQSVLAEPYITSVLGPLGGGTGFDEYTKGDILVADSTTSLSKQGVGNDGEAVVADSSESNGVRWGAPEVTRWRTDVVTANTTLAVATHGAVWFNAASGALTATLPASPTAGDHFHITKYDSSANAVTVDGNGNNINGASSVSLTAQYDSLHLIYNGTEWGIV